MEVSTEKTLVKTVKTQESRQGMCYFQRQQKELKLRLRYILFHKLEALTIH